VHGGDAFNVIPPLVKLNGTVRSYDPQVREMVLKRMREIIEGVAAACGARAELEIVPLTPAVINDEKITQITREAALAVLGPDHIASGERTMGSEDAAFFMQEIPGCYFFLGSANAERGLDAPHHNPRFDFDEEVLTTGVAIMMRTLARFLL
jgi:amidohydrolase